MQMILSRLCHFCLVFLRLMMLRSRLELLCLVRFELSRRLVLFIVVISLRGMLVIALLIRLLMRRRCRSLVALGIITFLLIARLVLALGPSFIVAVWLRSSL